MKKLIVKIFTSEIFWLSIILVLGFGVRLYKINNPIADWHSWRQADTASVSKNYFNSGINILYPKYHDVSSIQSGWFNPNGYRFVELPLFNVAHALLAKSFPNLSFEVWGRLTAIFCAEVSMVVLYFLGRRFLGKWGGVLSAFFFAFIPYNIYFTRVILPEPLTTVVALSALLAFVYFIDTDNLVYFFVSGVLMSIAMLLKPYIGFFLVPMIYLMLDKYGVEGIMKNSKMIVLGFIFLDIILIPLLLWKVWMNQFAAGIPFVEWAFNGDKIRFRPAFWRWIFVERLGKLILATWGLPLFVIGASWVKKNKYFVQAFLFGAFLYVSIVATANVRHDYYQIFIIPAISLACAAGSLYLIKGYNLNKTISRSLLVFSVILMLVFGFYQIKDFYNINHPELIRAGQAVNKLTPKNAWIVAPYNGDTAFLYQTNRWGWPAVDSSFEKLIERGADYYVSVNLGDTDTKYVTEHFKVLEQTSEYLVADLHQVIKPLREVAK